ncbi:MAG: hypothetical protein WC539_05355 [Nitrospirota bacterium]
MALSLINQLSAPFDIGKYKDTYSAKLMSLIKAKSRGEKVVPFKPRPIRKSENLMSQLKKSLETKKEKTAA